MRWSMSLRQTTRLRQGFGVASMTTDHQPSHEATARQADNGLAVLAAKLGTDGKSADHLSPVEDSPRHGELVQWRT